MDQLKAYVRLKFNRASRFPRELKNGKRYFIRTCPIRFPTWHVKRRELGKCACSLFTDTWTEKDGWLQEKCYWDGAWSHNYCCACCEHDDCQWNIATWSLKWEPGSSMELQPKVYLRFRWYGLSSDRLGQSILICLSELSSIKVKRCAYKWALDRNEKKKTSCA